MNKQELIEAYERISSFCGEISVNKAIENLKQLDESGIYVKNILARLRELPLHDREVWLKAIMGEFEQDFSHAKWREGYEQGKFEGAWVGTQLKDADKIRRELNRPIVPQFVADWIKYCKFTNVNLQNALLVGDVYFYNYANQKDFSKLKEFLDTENNPELFARAWLDGYEVEEESKYTVKIKAVNQYLVKNPDEEFLGFLQSRLKSKFTRKELEEAGFGWVFSCEGVEIEEVE